MLARLCDSEFIKLTKMDLPSSKPEYVLALFIEPDLEAMLEDLVYWRSQLKSGMMLLLSLQLWYWSDSDAQDDPHRIFLCVLAVCRT
jgi:hypothetical protein